MSVLDMGSGAAMYELVTDLRHHHFVCRICGRETRLGHDLVGAFFIGLEADTGFEVSTNHFVLFGVARTAERTATQPQVLDDA